MALVFKCDLCEKEKPMEESKPYSNKAFLGNDSVICEHCAFVWYNGAWQDGNDIRKQSLKRQRELLKAAK